MILHNWDCLEYLKILADNSIDAIATDPPYWLKFMWKKRDYDVPKQQIREECLRVLKPWWHLMAFAWTRTQHRMAVRIEDAGFEIRDMICRVYGSWFPKSLNIWKTVDKIQGNDRKIIWPTIYPDWSKWRQTAKHFQWESLWWQSINTQWTSEREWRGTALKPAIEPITLARKPIDKWLSIAENCLKRWVGGINIDASRVETDEKITIHSRSQNAVDNMKIFIDKRTLETHQTDWQKIWRFPANLIHDNSEEVIECFPNTKSGWWLTKRKNKDAMFDFWNGYERQEISDSWNASRFFKSIIYQAKASKSERNMWMEEWQTNKHPTVKSLKLMEYLINMVTRQWQTILDPFMWSWTTWIACKKLWRDFIGCELDPEYFKICEARINNFKVETTLFT